MKYKLFALPQSGLGYFKRKLHVVLGPDTRGVVAIRGDSKVGAAVALHQWTENACWAHWVIDEPASLRCGVFESVADYVFNQSGCGKIFGTITSENVRSLKLAKRIGFTEVGRLKDGFKDGVDFILVELTKENCRYL